MKNLDEETQKWIERHQRQYDEALEKGGLLSGRQIVAFFNALPAAEQRKLMNILFPKGTVRKEREEHANHTTSNRQTQSDHEGGESANH